FTRLLEMPSQVEDRHIDQVGTAHVLVAPDILQQLLAADYALGVTDEVRQQVERGWAKAQAAILAVRLAAVLVDAQVSVGDDALARAGIVDPPAAELRAH